MPPGFTLPFHKFINDHPRVNKKEILGYSVTMAPTVLQMETVCTRCDHHWGLHQATNDACPKTNGQGFWHARFTTALNPDSCVSVQVEYETAVQRAQQLWDDLPDFTRSTFERAGLGRPDYQC